MEPRSCSDFHQSKSGSFFREKPTWQLLLGLRGGEALGLSTIGGTVPAIRSCRLDVARPRPCISSTQSSVSLPTVRRISPSTSYSVHPVLEPYFSHCCPLGGLQLAPTAIAKLGYLCSTQSRGPFPNLEPTGSRMPFPEGTKW